MVAKWVMGFAEGRAEMRDLLGGKGANLAEMTRIGLPVPPGFTITTEACRQYLATRTLWPELKTQVTERLKQVEQAMGRLYGAEEQPLLVSVRSGAAFSMPGMMETILNVGLNDRSVEGLGRAMGNRRFAWDCYRRLLEKFSEVVMEIPASLFKQQLEAMKQRHGVKDDTSLGVDELQALVEEYRKLIRRETKKEFPQDPVEQIFLAIEAVFKSWLSPTASFYRTRHQIPEHLGTAVNVQSMVFGNLGDQSGTGVAFTRSPSTGDKQVFGEYLLNAQGEDVVAGVRTPTPIASLAGDMPEIYAQFLSVCDLLEKHYRDMQDIEYTIENGRLFLLQTRNGKRTARAAVKVAVDLVQEGIIAKPEAMMRIRPDEIDQLLHPSIDPSAKLNVIAKGLPASPGAATGQAVFDPELAQEMAGRGVKAILMRPETSPEDIQGMAAAQGVVTSHGGMTSHAAVVMRGWGKPCVCGCDALRIDLVGKRAQVGDLVIAEGDVVSIDGSTGRIILGEIPLVSPDLSDELVMMLEWADAVSRLQVRANADNPVDAAKARELGAKGIGLCRTEHMFMESDRRPIVQEMILAETAEERKAALARLLPIQRDDFYHILRIMDGLPVTIRLLDPPLHEFLPHDDEIIREGVDLFFKAADPVLLHRRSVLLRKVRALQEHNPMLGHRGCRLGMVYPEIYEMQVRAICQAAAQLVKEKRAVTPEIMIPLVGEPNELDLMRQMTTRVYQEVCQETGVSFDCPIGTMIELPRACVVADGIARHADFFSFGTNDLTQTVFGFSRDDAEGKFLHHYLHMGILKENPFAVIDREGVGRLMTMAVELGRGVKEKLKLGICGEHGGDPQSIAFCHAVGLNYVSCSPYRVPVARLAAAHAAMTSQPAVSSTI